MTEPNPTDAQTVTIGLGFAAVAYFLAAPDPMQAVVLIPLAIPAGIGARWARMLLVGEESEPDDVEEVSAE